MHECEVVLLCYGDCTSYPIVGNWLNACLTTTQWNVVVSTIGLLANIRIVLNSNNWWYGPEARGHMCGRRTRSSSE